MYRKPANRSLFVHISRTPLLTAEQEIELGRAIQLWLNNESRIKALTNYVVTDTDQRIAEVGELALKRMVKANLRLVVSVCRKRYQHYAKQHSFDDLLQAGALGLDRAARKYDPSKGYRFSTYALNWIRQRISAYHEENSRAVRLPAHLYEKHGRIRRAIKSLKQDGETPSIAQIANHIGEKPILVSSTLQVFAMESSLDAPIPGTEFCMMDNLADPNAVNLERLNLYEVIKRGIEAMPDDVAEVLILNYFHGKSIRQIAEEKGVRPSLLKSRHRTGLTQLRQLIGV